MMAAKTSTSLKALAQNEKKDFDQPDRERGRASRHSSTSPPMIAATKPFRPIKKPLS